MRLLVIALLLASALYGASFQAFRQYDIASPLAGPDPRSYVAMSHGNFDVFPVRRYRPIVPMLAAAVRVPLATFVADRARLDYLSFYVVNFALAIAAALVLHATLMALGFDWKLGLIGALIFVTSRVTVASVSAPLVDTLFFLAIGVISWLTATGRGMALALAMPLLALSKETVLPFLFLPIFSRATRSWKIGLSIVVSIAAMFALRAWIDSRVATPQMLTLGQMLGLLTQKNVPQSVAKLLRPAGFYDLFNGFGLVAVMALAGWVQARRGRARCMPAWVALPVPLAFGYALVSFNLGRLFFAAYVPAIAYALVLLESVLTPAGPAAPPTSHTRPPAR